MFKNKTGHYIVLILSALAFLTGCTAQNNEIQTGTEALKDQEAAAMKTEPGDSEPENSIGIMTLSPESQAKSGAPDAVNTLDYMIKEDWIQSENAEVRYPIVEGPVHQNLREPMNAAIYSAVNGYVNAAVSDGDQVTLDFEVKRMDTEILSIVISGIQPHESGAYNVMFSVNLDARNAREINAGNLFLKDEATKEALSQLLKEADPNFASEFGTWLGIYFEKDTLNFFYLENDKASVYNVITIPTEKLSPYFETASEPSAS